jgi:HPt (histidine-containing phosphotransfer) domain-containing protein
VVAALRELDEGGEDDLFTELVALFVEDAERLVGELQAALAEGDAHRLERCAHTLKSSSASLGAVRLSAICFELEKRGRAQALDDVAELVRETGESCRRACRALESLRA